jgi:hypothetical protein
MLIHSPEEKITKAKAICEEYAKGDSTIASCAENQGISDRTFLNWIDELSEVSDMYKQARKEADQRQRGTLKQRALNSLNKLILGFEYTETKRTVEPIYDKEGNKIGQKNVSVQVITKHQGPNPTACIFALKHIDERFKENQLPEYTEPQTFVIGDQKIAF